VRRGSAKIGGMPNTLAGLLVFIVVLLPGFVFITIYTWDRPRRRWSTLEETAAILLASVIAEAAAAALYATIRLRMTITGPRLDLLILKPTQHLGWVTALLATASLLAAFTGLLMRLKRVHPAVTSSWWTLFDHWLNAARRDENGEGGTTEVQCVLDDGSSVTGVLGDWNTIQDDSPDRDLILKRPIKYRPPGAQGYVDHPVSAVCISARRIVVMFVAYTGEITLSTPSKAAEAAEAEAEEAAAPSPARSPDAGPALRHDPGPPPAE
jgi:hypothetical protein